MISFDEAVERLTRLASPLDREMLPLDCADGRRLAGPIIAQYDAPRAPTSAMDGYAIRDADVANGICDFTVVGKSFAGEPYLAELARGTTARVFTGALVPPGTGRVVMQEDVCVQGNRVVVKPPLSESRHLRTVGADFHSGDTLVEGGRILTPQTLIAIAAADLAAVEVFVQPRVSILCCGDELAEPGSADSGKGQIPESVSFGVAALVRRWGGKIARRVRVPDALDTLTTEAGRALEHGDVVVTIGGASVGERDFAKQMFAPLGLEFVFDKVAMRPAKPVWLGHIGQKIILGLPGNPTSAYVAARLFLAPLLCGLGGGAPSVALAWRDMVLAGQLEASPQRDTFFRAKDDGCLVLPLTNQDSAAQKAIAEADLLIRRRPEAPQASAGAFVETLVI